MALNPQFGTIVPSQLQQTLANNYLTFDGAAGGNFAHIVFVTLDYNCIAWTVFHF